MNHTAKAIKELRKTKGLTQADLAKLLKTTPQFICLVENGRSKLPLPMAKKLIKGLFKKYDDSQYTRIILASLKNDACTEINKKLGI